MARFQHALSVEPIRNSRLVQVKVSNADPAQAANIANALAKAFIATHIERKMHSSVYAREYLEEQIRQTKAKLEESERVINSYAKKNEILNLGDKGSAATQTFVDFSAALARAARGNVDRVMRVARKKGEDRNVVMAPPCQRFSKAGTRSTSMSRLNRLRPWDWPSAFQRASSPALSAAIRSSPSARGSSAAGW